MIVRSLFCILVSLIGLLPLFFIYDIPILLSDLYAFKLLINYSNEIEIISFLTYGAMTLGWICNIRIKTKYFIYIARAIFIIIFCLGVLATYGTGILLTLPTLLISIYLLYSWYPDKYKETLKS